MVNIINGKEQANKITQKVTDYANQYINETNITPNLAVILIGDNKASQTYVQAKINMAKKCGFKITLHKFETSITETDLLDLLADLNNDNNVNGILIQLPLPKHLNVATICQSIDPLKDVDGFTYTNVGKLWVDANKNYTHNNSLLPCTPLGILYLLVQIHGYDFSGLDAVIVGRSNIVSKPIAGLLLAHNATITITHSKTSQLEEVTRSADILIIAAGKAKLISKNAVKVGATIIDVGINHINSTEENRVIVGDVNFKEVKDIAANITPVPGGVGPMTIAMLMYNTLKATCLQTNYEILELI